MSAAPAVRAKWTDEPPRDCGRCERLAQFRADNAKRYPDYFNAPVPSFGSPDARLLIVGLAPGLHGANRTGRPFTGDWAGDLLYATLKAQGLARGEYGERADDGFTLIDCAITNAVRCVPPENKPTPAEINTCRDFLTKQIGADAQSQSGPDARADFAQQRLSALGIKKKDHPFAHGATHHTGKITLVASYHCSRYNTNTGVLTTEMFEKAVAVAKKAANL